MRGLGLKNIQYKADEASVMRVRKEVEMRIKFGIPQDYFGETELDKSIYTEDEIEAIMLLEDGKELPLELQERLMESMSERKKRNEKFNIK